MRIKFADLWSRTSKSKIVTSSLNSLWSSGCHNSYISLKNITINTKTQKKDLFNHKTTKKDTKVTKDAQNCWFLVDVHLFLRKFTKKKSGILRSRLRASHSQIQSSKIECKSSIVFCNLYAGTVSCWNSESAPVHNLGYYKAFALMWSICRAEWSPHVDFHWLRFSQKLSIACGIKKKNYF